MTGPPQIPAAAMTQEVDMDALPEIDAQEIADPPIEDSDSEDDDSKEIGLRKADQWDPQLQCLQVPSLQGTIQEGFTVNSTLLRYCLAIIDSIVRK